MYGIWKWLFGQSGGRRDCCKKGKTYSQNDGNESGQLVGVLYRKAYVFTYHLSWKDAFSFVMVRAESSNERVKMREKYYIHWYGKNNPFSPFQKKMNRCLRMSKKYFTFDGFPSLDLWTEFNLVSVHSN